MNKLERDIESGEKVVDVSGEVWTVLGGEGLSNRNSSKVVFAENSKGLLYDIGGGISKMKTESYKEQNNVV